MGVGVGVCGRGEGERCGSSKSIIFSVTDKYKAQNCKESSFKNKSTKRKERKRRCNA